MPRLARSSARLGPTPLIMRTSVVRERDIDRSFIPLRQRHPPKSAAATVHIHCTRKKFAEVVPSWGTAVPRPYNMVTCVVVARIYIVGRCLRRLAWLVNGWAGPGSGGCLCGWRSELAGRFWLTTI